MLSSRPGQSGRADGYILEGAEFEVRRSCFFALIHCTAQLTSSFFVLLSSVIVLPQAYHRASLDVYL